MEHHYLHHLYDSFSTEDKVVCSTSIIIGWALGVNFLVSWGLLLSTFLSIATASITALACAMSLDFYKEKLKHRIFKKKKDIKDITDDTEKRA